MSRARGGVPAAPAAVSPAWCVPLCVGASVCVCVSDKVCDYVVCMRETGPFALLPSLFRSAPCSLHHREQSGSSSRAIQRISFGLAVRCFPRLVLLWIFVWRYEKTEPFSRQFFGPWENGPLLNVPFCAVASFLRLIFLVFY